MKFALELAEDPPFLVRELISCTRAVTLATDILALDHKQFSAAFRKSPMNGAKLRGLQRNAAAVVTNVRLSDALARVAQHPDARQAISLRRDVADDEVILARKRHASGARHVIATRAHHHVRGLISVAPSATSA
ncbi:MAG: hypothetical protein V4813_16680 [Gemmatimonadota bacterium]